MSSGFVSQNIGGVDSGGSHPLFLFLPMDTFYFSHDYNARTDDKIKQLIRKHGMLGYGIFWAIVEDLYQNANAMRTDCDGIAHDLHTHTDIVKSILYDFDLFIHDDDKFGSLSIQKRLNERKDKSVKARESANKRWNKNDDANAMRPQCDRNAHKVQESKVKEIINTDTNVSVKRFTPPTHGDVIQYAQETGKGSRAAPGEFHDYYTSNGWKVGKNGMKDWRAAYRKWVTNEKKYETNQRTNQNTETPQQRKERIYRESGSTIGRGGEFSDIFSIPHDSQ
jgi:hypothetical protein